MHAIMKMASASASACCVCKTPINAGNCRLLNRPREVESNKKFRDFLNKFCHSPLNTPDIPSFISTIGQTSWSVGFITFSKTKGRVTKHIDFHQGRTQGGAQGA